MVVSVVAAPAGAGTSLDRLDGNVFSPAATSGKIVAASPFSAAATIDWTVGSPSALDRLEIEVPPTTSM